MGVPRLFKWLCERYSHTVKSFDKTTCSKPIQTVDNLYIDANAIIHECAQHIFNYGGARRLLNPYRKLSLPEKYNMLFNMFFDRIMELTTYVRPTKILYIAIDGCAPAGKMTQQRQRRFMASRESDSSSNLHSQFDSNCISPGTVFMDELRQFMNYRILEEYEENPQLQSAKVIFSSADVPSEGEHKIMEYIRNNEIVHSQSNCMFGPDGDLIMLTLTAECEQFYLLRDDQYKLNHMNIVDITQVKKELVKNKKADATTIIHDFILMGFFVGNDFLPKIQMFYYLEDGMDFMLKIYSDLNETLTVDGNINITSFIKFIKIIKQQEKSFLEEQICKNLGGDPKFENKTLMKCVKTVNGETVKYVFDYKKYKKLYNEKILESSSGHPEQVSHDYMKGLDWVFKYYTQDCPSFRWFYPHYYSPLMEDFAKYMPDDFQVTYRKREKIPHFQFQQLLAILPPKSKHLLPKELSHLLTDKKSPIIDLYPETFEVDYEGKYQNYQGIAILPLVDYKRLQKCYDKYVGESDKRNKRGKVYTFSYGKDSKMYKTKYGKVQTKVKIDLI